MESEIKTFDLFSWTSGVKLCVTRKVMLDDEEYSKRKEYDFATVKEAIEYLYKEVSTPTLKEQ